MPLTAATEAARLSVAPMLDGRDVLKKSMICSAACAVHVHVSIVRLRMFSGPFRGVSLERTDPWSSAFP